MSSNSTPGSSASHLTPPAIADVHGPREIAILALETLRRIVSPLASLKITVTLLTLSIFIILFGTLAQVEKDMWEVMAIYFRSWVARVPLAIFFPRAWSPPFVHDAMGTRYFFFPGGAAIGLGLAINLLSAGISGGSNWIITNVLRSKKKINVGKLLGGLAALSIGVTITVLIILRGHNREGLQGTPPFSWEALWALSKAGLFVLFMLSVGGFVVWLIKNPRQFAELILLAVTSIVLGSVSIYLLIPGNETYVGDSSMRILWQLMQATFAAVVLLLGLTPLFGKKCGVVLLHSGVALMMFGQFFVGRYDVEEQMAIQEGQVMNYAQDIRTVELAVIDPNDSKHPDEESVVAIPLHHTGQPTRFLKDKITDAALPFDLQIVEFLKNSDVHVAKESEKKVATAGRVKDFVATERRKGSGTDMGGGVDLASVYVNVLKKGTNESLGVYLISQVVLMMRDGKEFGFDENVDVAGKKYGMSLRFQRNYKPYSITLKDVRKDDYIGTNTPRNYSSDIRLVDARRNVDRDIHIWMNNPLRYSGETFYQSGYNVDPLGKEHTTLQVVRNSGWMIPYVACMFVVVGMCAHFVQVLLRFLRRTSASAIMSSLGPKGAESPFAQAFTWMLGSALASQKKPAAQKSSSEMMLGVGLPAAVVMIFAGWCLMAARPPKEPVIFVDKDKGIVAASGDKSDGEAKVFNVNEFGRLPVVADGRVKPFDTLARNTLRVLSGKEEFRDQIIEKRTVTPGWLARKIFRAKDPYEYEFVKSGKKHSAMRWLLDVISESEASVHHKVFRIDNPEVLDTLGLTRREGFLYSVEELMPKIGDFEKQVEQARKQEKEKGIDSLAVYQRKILEVDTRIRTFTKLGAAFRHPHLPPLPSVEEFNKDRSTAIRKMEEFRREYAAFSQSLEKAQIPLAVPIRSDEKKKVEWQPYSKAWVAGMIDTTMLGRDPDPGLVAMNTMLINYARGDAAKFNDAIGDYRRLLDRIRPEGLDVANTFSNRTVESWFGSFYGFEAYFNHLAPFYHADVLYVIAFALAAAAWLGLRRPLNSASLWLLVFTFAIHSAALVARIYISGRPPVTNLYSSAVFIGWGCVAFGLMIEILFGLGIGNIIAATIGFASLFIAHNLAADGDTFFVLQAVLDTQFWLATHVVCISFGYATTFLAGFLGLFYIVCGVFTPSLTSEQGKELNRMIYGTICFAIFFSFFGTVLGGLWADDSWGRFWGWDPKENGALIIVLWNAVVLHSRWGGLVKERGLAVLSVVGNIVTAWSWFGVNELGVGLHSYGFTEGRLMYLAMFVVSQVAMVGIGCLPRSVWWSFRMHDPVVAQVARQA